MIANPCKLHIKIAAQRIGHVVYFSLRALDVVSGALEDAEGIGKR